MKYISTGKIYKSNSPLTSMELLNIANEAKNVIYLEGAVDWLDVALQKAKSEEKKSNYISVIE